MSSVPSNATLLSRLTAAKAGVAKRLASTTSVMLKDVAWKPADIETVFQAAIDGPKTVAAAKASWQKTVADGKAARSKALALLASLRAFLVASSDQVDLLGDFGFAPAKPKKVPVKTKAAAVDKTLATRAALGTMGTVQKKQAKAAAKAAPKPATTAPAPTAPSSPKPTA
jgi:hypothetical protein